MGPFTIYDVQTRVNTGEIVPSDLAFYEGLPNWISVRELLSNDIQSSTYDFSQPSPPTLSPPTLSPPNPMSPKPFFKKTYSPIADSSKSNSFAIAGMVLGILSCVLCLRILSTPSMFVGKNDFLIVLITGVPGLVFSNISLKKKVGRAQMATAGRTCSTIGCAFVAACIVIYIVIPILVKYAR